MGFLGRFRFWVLFGLSLLGLFYFVLFCYSPAETRTGENT